jgi:hypothetical protein
LSEKAQVKPANKICWDTTNLHVQTKVVETVLNMYPGRLVARGTGDHDVLACGAAGHALGWLGYEQTDKKNRPATVDTIYLVNANAAIINGAGIGVVGCLAPGCTVTKGERLTMTTLGQLTPAVIGTDDVVAIAEESITTTGAVADYEDIMVRSVI